MTSFWKVFRWTVRGTCWLVNTKMSHGSEIKRSIIDYWSLQTLNLISGSTKWLLQSANSKCCVISRRYLVFSHNGLISSGRQNFLQFRKIGETSKAGKLQKTKYRFHRHMQRPSPVSAYDQTRWPFKIYSRLFQANETGQNCSVKKINMSTK